MAKSCPTYSVTWNRSLTGQSLTYSSYQKCSVFVWCLDFGTPFRNDQLVGHFEMESQTEAPNEHATVMGSKAYANIKKNVHTPAGREPGTGNGQDEVCQVASGVRLASLFLNQLDKRHAHGGARKKHPMSQSWPRAAQSSSITWNRSLTVGSIRVRSPSE